MSHSVNFKQRFHYDGHSWYKEIFSSCMYIGTLVCLFCLMLRMCHVSYVRHKIFCPSSLLCDPWAAPLDSETRLLVKLHTPKKEILILRSILRPGWNLSYVQPWWLYGGYYWWSKIAKKKGIEQLLKSSFLAERIQEPGFCVPEVLRLCYVVQLYTV